MWKLLSLQPKDKSGVSQRERGHEEEDEEYYDYEEDEQDEQDDDDATSEENNDEEEEQVDALLIPSDLEKKSILASFDSMRKDSLFCDVSFMVQGVLFRAHRVVVSSWSRWMKSSLCDTPDEDVITLDIFTPEAFQAVLDYMYGNPLTLTIDVSEMMLSAFPLLISNLNSLLTNSFLLHNRMRTILSR